MVAEAISSMGRNDAVLPWVDIYKAKRRHNPTPPPRMAIDAADETAWKEALGKYDRIADWLDLFRAALGQHRWQEVLRQWIPRFTNGFAGGLTHGVIRTAHAVRYLSQAAVPTGLELDEFARGLAYWAANYREVAGNPDAAGESSLEEALCNLPRFNPADAAQGVVDVFARVDSLGRLQGFTGAVESLRRVSDPGDAISHHTAIFARILVAQKELRQIPMIQLVHPVTSAAALRTLLPFLPDAFGVWAYRRLWQASAAIVAQIAHQFTVALKLDEELGEPAFGVAELVDRAIEHKDEHVIKLAAACLGEDRIRPNPVYRLAAEAALQRIRPWIERPRAVIP